MSKNWAIAVGINHYNNLRDLRYAKRDAEAMRGWFEKKGDFDRVFLFTDNSPEIPAKPSPIITQPTFGNLRRFLRAQFGRKILDPGSNLWFFFAGHGRRAANRDYLMLSDSDPGDIEPTAIAVHYIIEQLRESGADNIVLFLDACREESSRGDGLGEEHRGVVTFYSCSPTQQSYEIKELQHGAFTYALIEALQIQGVDNCATVHRLEQYLCRRVPEINHKYPQGQGKQSPYIIPEPASKLYLILLPKYATPHDIDTLKVEAFRAENGQDYETARQLWLQVNIVAQGTDMDAIDAIRRFSRWEIQTTVPSQNTMTAETRGVIAPTSSLTPFKLKPLLAPKLVERSLGGIEVRLRRSALGQSSLAWTKIEGASGYVLERSAVKSFKDAVEVYSGDKISFQLPPFLPFHLLSSAMYYRVKAKGSYINEDSPWSNVVEIKPKPYKRPIRPNKLSLPAPKLVELSLRGIEVRLRRSALGQSSLAWTKIEGASGYVLERSAVKSFKDAVEVYSGDKISFQLPPFLPFHLLFSAMYYRVKAKGSYINEDSPWSNVVEIKPTKDEPSKHPIPFKMASMSAPKLEERRLSGIRVGLGLSNLGQSSLAWTKIEGASGYVLERSTVKSFKDSAEVYSGDKTSFMILFPSFSTMYYRVKAKGELLNEDSPWSNVVEIIFQGEEE